MVLMTRKRSAQDAKSPSRKSVMAIYAAFAVILLLGAAGASLVIGNVGIVVLAAVLVGMVGIVTWFSHSWCVRVFFDADRDSA